jgi:Sec-independent protein translocase protein TatA
MTRRAIWIIVCLAVWGGTMSTALAQDQAAAIEELKKEMRELRKEVSAKNKKIDELERRIDAVQKAASTKEPVKAAAKTVPATPQTALDQAVQAVQGPAPGKGKVAAAKGEAALDQAVKAVQAPQEERKSLLSYKAGGATLRLLDVSFDIMAAGGTSTATDQQLQNGLQGGGHDPRKRGFTLQQAELSLAGAVDPYFNGEAHIVYFIDPATGESVVELEEAFLTTQKLPWGLQFKGGHFLTEFGRINPTHPHAWHWLDQPVINSRIFGPDGMRAPGVRVSWLTPLPWYSQLYFGMQNANGAMVSLLSNDANVADRPIGGYPFFNRQVQTLKDLTYFARVENSWDLSPTVTSKLGFSGIYGPNYTGPHGDTWIYGSDLVVKWRPTKNYQGWPFLLWESELIGRTFRAYPEDQAAIPGKILRDLGFYTQVLWGFKPRWAIGVRGEYAGGSGNGVTFNPDIGAYDYISRSYDPFRGNRYRISPLLIWQPSEFSRLRLQYNHDWAGFLPNRKSADTVWVGMEIMYGAHPAHKY